MRAREVKPGMKIWRRLPGGKRGKYLGVVESYSKVLGMVYFKAPDDPCNIGSFAYPSEVMTCRPTVTKS